MKRLAILALSSLPLFLAGNSSAQIAGSTTLGVATAELTQIATGWSVKKKMLGRDVYNDNKQKVGKIDDIIIAPNGRASYFIVGAGGFVGVGKHDVAIPVAQISEQDGKLVLAGATKNAIKALPKFDYAK
jgi:sporulation protein YlmC with PRC-barrel domain